MTAGASHWEHVYRNKASDDVSWFQHDPRPSLDALKFRGPDHQSLIDVGGGASRLVDTLDAQGWHDLTVLDISGAALAQARARMGARAANVRWIVADLTAWQPDRTYDVWHDRAVFHFLTDSGQRAAYLGALKRVLCPGGLAIVATFAPDGPDKCSGLPVCKYDAQTMGAELGPAFRLLHTFREVHRTPGGVPQPFCWCVFEHAPDAASG